MSKPIPPSFAATVLAVLGGLSISSEHVRHWLLLFGDAMKEPVMLMLALLLMAVLLCCWLLLHSMRERGELREELNRSNACLLTMAMLLQQDQRFRGKLPDAQKVIDGEMTITEWMNALTALSVPMHVAQP